MTPDNELLRRYVEQGDEAAFAEVVRRHLNLAYACAVRVLNNDAALAQDVTQAVFTDLARKAAALCTHPTVAGWLHTSVRFAASKAARAEQTRRAREQEAIAMTDQTTERDVCWGQLRPLLDEAVGQLRDAERNALLLRFFEDKSHREIGAVLGVSEGAAQMRVERALEKLRRHFTRRGVNASAALLATTLGTQAASATAPAAFAATVAGQALTGATGVTALTAGGGLRALFATKARATLAGTLALMTIAFVIFWAMPKNATGRSEPTAPAHSPNPASAVKISNTPAATPQPTPNMTPSQVIRTGTIAAALLVSAPMAPAQPAPPPPPPPAEPPAVNYPTVAQPFAAPASPITASPAAMALAKDNNQFALDLYRQFSPSGNANAFFSPYSISTALAMTAAGARNATAEQMTKALHLDGLSAEAMPPAFAALQKALLEAQTRSGLDLYVANSLWAEQAPEHVLLSDYLNQVQSNFNAVMFPVDFKNHADDAASRINTWVADNTKDKIKDILHPGDLDSSARLVLVNAIYFKGAWAQAFQPRSTTSQPFTLADGSSKQVMLMHQIFNVGGYADIGDAAVPFQMLSLNYVGPPDTTNPPVRGGRGAFRSPVGPDARLFSLVVLLPRANDGLAALEKSLTADQLSTWMGRLVPYTRVNVFLPKFKLQERYNLGSTLTAMGMSDAFSSSAADFSGMDGVRDLFIGLVIHQTFIDLDEKGTEAAAATVVGMPGGGRPATPPPPPPVFRADHPFLFLIRDNTTGSILFLGRLANPD